MYLPLKRSGASLLENIKLLVLTGVSRTPACPHGGIGLLLRLYNLGFNSLWLDEASTYTFSISPFPRSGRLRRQASLTPLFYWVEHVMLMLGNNEIHPRFFPALPASLRSRSFM